MIRCNVRVRQFFAYSVFAYFTYFSLSICSRHLFDRNRFFSGFVFTSKRVPWGTFLRTHSWWRRLDKRQREISPSSSGDSNLQTSKSAVQCSSTRATIVAHHALVLLWFLNPSFLDIHNLKCSKKTNLCSFHLKTTSAAKPEAVRRRKQMFPETVISGSESLEIWVISPRPGVEFNNPST